MLRHLAKRPGLMFALVFAWKLALLVFTAQPVPANDSFFYDGPVVNYLNDGSYTNPSLVLTLPTSGTKVFAAYPPLYQLILTGWMAIFGSSALAAMWLHLALYGIYMLTLFGILRRLGAPIWSIHIAGAFLFANTFHDRPDSLCQTLGMLAIYFWLRSSISGPQSPERGDRSKWVWLAVAFAVLSVFAGPVIGAVYLFIIGGLEVANACSRRERFAIWPMAVLVVFPPGIVYAISVMRPDLWAGFLEHAHQTPSLSNLHGLQLLEVVKVLRNVPGVLMATGLTLILLPKFKSINHEDQRLVGLVTLVVGLAAAGVVLGCLLFLTPNLVHVAGYFQPLIVAGFLTVIAPIVTAVKWRKGVIVIFLMLAGLSSIRAVGITTWGVACALDVSYPKALNMVRHEIDTTPEGRPVIFSAAYLYEAARHKNIDWIHSDWLGPMPRGGRFSFPAAIAKLKPDKMILTQFDYYRRYESILQELKTHPEVAEINISNSVTTKPPDAYGSMQKVIQHVSWAPVIVTLKWKVPRE